MRLGICGLGTVGRSLLHALAEAQRDGRAGDIELVACASRRGAEGVEPELLAAFAGLEVDADVLALARRDDLDAVVELIGGTDTAGDIAEAVLGGGRRLVTANKALLAERGDQVQEWLGQGGGALFAEAAVAGGVPVVRTLAELLRGDRAREIAGILNGTCNFILTRMERGGDYVGALQAAQEAGFAEADPSMDVQGRDALQKICILAAIAFGARLPAPDVQPGGIERLEPVDLEVAETLGCRVRHLARAQLLGDGVGVGAQLAMVPQDNAFAAVCGETNAVSVTGTQIPLVTLTGPGAGGGATAAAVLSDVLAAAQPAPPRPLFSAGRDGPAIRDLDDLVERRYLRLYLEDRPGVMAGLSSLLAKHGSNIEELLQRPQRGPDGAALAVAVLGACDTHSLRGIEEDLARFPGNLGAVLHMPMLAA